MEARDNITHQIKEAVRKSEMKTFRSMETIWDRIEEKLDEEEQEQKKIIPFRKISIAAAVLLFLSLGAVYVFQTDSIKQNLDPVYVQQRNESAKPLTDPEINTDREVVKEISTDKTTSSASTLSIKPKHRQAQQKAAQQKMIVNIDVNAIQNKNQSLENQELYVAPKTIKGRIADENGEGVAGAIVQVKGTNNNTLTDLNGDYEIVVRNGQEELEIKGIGMVSKTIDISKSEHVLTTRLEADNTIVAAIAIYSPNADKKSYYGSVASLPSKDAGSKAVTDISKALEGEVPGVQITYTKARTGVSDIMVRGMSISGLSGSPLIVIDGNFYNGSLVSLKSDELESLTVLKDGNATSLYGSKGVNGVIIIKTKNGKGYSRTKEDILQKMNNTFNKKDKKESEQNEE
jgi:TonB-dependent SusC/RagA subfamily outer membrane receptor